MTTSDKVWAVLRKKRRLLLVELNEKSASVRRFCTYGTIDQQLVAVSELKELEIRLKVMDEIITEADG